MRHFILLLTVAGCALPQGSVERSSRAIVRATDVAGQAQRCVPILSPQNALQAIDSRTLYYRSAGIVWINRLSNDCPHLRPTSKLAISIVGSRYCSGDALRVIDPGTDASIAVCTLGYFTPHR